MEKEEWRDIPNYEGLYQASSLGVIRSLDRVVLSKDGKKKPFKGLNQVGWLGDNGYKTVSLSKLGVKKTFYVHQLIAITFLRHKPNKYEKIINHINHNKLDNRVENLEVITQRQNTIHHHSLNDKDYVGVYQDKENGKFRARISVNGKMIHLGTFDNAKNASNAYQEAVIATENNQDVKCNKTPTSSKYKGVTFRKDTKRWNARIWLNGKDISLGCFATELEAHRAFQDKLLELPKCIRDKKLKLNN